jgi:hypothetical protein
MHTFLVIDFTGLLIVLAVAFVMSLRMGAWRPRPDYIAIARMEREIFGTPGSPLCPCKGTLPHHIRSPHYLPGYDAAGLMSLRMGAWRKP